MKLGIKFDKTRFANDARREISARLDQVAVDLGSLVVSQMVDRLERGGDDEITYEDLWANRSSSPDSFRRGGQPLIDNGTLINSFTFNASQIRSGVRINVGSPLTYARYQHYGFKTDGPNYIPLTLKARRKPKGADPKVFGLKRGVDYIMAWNGVDVPARPILRFSAGNRQEIREAIGVSLTVRNRSGG